MTCIIARHSLQSREEASDMNAVGGGGASEGVGSVFGGFFSSILESASLSRGSGEGDDDSADVIFSSDSLVSIQAHYEFDLEKMFQVKTITKDICSF